MMRSYMIGSLLCVNRPAAHVDVDDGQFQPVELRIASAGDGIDQIVAAPHGHADSVWSSLEIDRSVDASNPQNHGRHAASPSASAASCGTTRASQSAIAGTPFVAN